MVDVEIFSRTLRRRGARRLNGGGDFDPPMLELSGEREVEAAVVVCGKNGGDGAHLPGRCGKRMKTSTRG